MIRATADAVLPDAKPTKAITVTPEDEVSNAAGSGTFVAVGVIGDVTAPGCIHFDAEFTPA
jgi:hypothetical protein